jgi:hypothetical protein
MEEALSRVNSQMAHWFRYSLVKCVLLFSLLYHRRVLCPGLLGVEELVPQLCMQVLLVLLVGLIVR